MFWRGGLADNTYSPIATAQWALAAPVCRHSQSSILHVVEPKFAHLSLELCGEDGANDQTIDAEDHRVKYKLDEELERCFGHHAADPISSSVYA